MALSRRSALAAHEQRGVVITPKGDFCGHCTTFPSYLTQTARLVGSLAGSPALDDVLCIRAVCCCTASTGKGVCFVELKGD